MQAEWSCHNRRCSPWVAACHPTRQPGCTPAAAQLTEEELGAVGVGSRVGHGQHARPQVAQLEVLVRKAGAVDGVAAGACRQEEEAVHTLSLYRQAPCSSSLGGMKADEAGLQAALAHRCRR